MRTALLAALVLAALGGCDIAPPADAGPPDAQRPDAGPLPEFVEDARWHRHAVFYELWVRSFADSDGDGIGDLPGLTSRLDYLEDLGVGGIWLMPTYPSPLADSGYDVADYVGVHPDYGTAGDLDTLITEAHARGLRIYMDLVFNHTSLEHEWFVDSQSDPSGARGDWFVWSDVEGPGCEGSQGVFGAVRWTEDPTRGQFYFHQFYPQQPDLNFDQPAMREALLDVARFWLDRGVDGFRLDVPYRFDEDLPVCTHRPGTFDFLRELRAVTDSYDGERAMVGEILASLEDQARYLESDLLQMGFILAEATLFWAAANSGSVGGLPAAIDELVSLVPEGGAFAPLLGNHDLARTTATVGDDPGALRVMAGTLLTLPGVPFVYYGEELGMRSGTDVIVDSRDSARTPMQWDATAGAGFSAGTPFLALAPEHETRNVEVERADPGSLFQFYRALIHLRNETPALRTGSYQRAAARPSIYAYWRRHPEGDRLVVVNYARAPRAFDAEVPWTSAVDAVSGDAVGEVTGRLLEAEVPAQTVWVLSGS